MVSPIAFRLLGPLEVVVDGQTVELTGQKLRALLALLLLEPNRVVASERLIEELWDGRPPATAAKALQVYVSQLRRLLGHDRLETKAPGYLIRIEPNELDLLQFRSLRQRGRLREALALWRGPPLADFAYQQFAQAEIARLREERLACLEERIESDLAQGLQAEVVGELEALVHEQPLRERFQGLLMRALYRSGRQADALATYRRAREALVGQLGIEPGHELRELQQAILKQDPLLDAVSRPPSGSAGSTRSPFVGRDQSVNELLASLEEAFAGRGRLFLLVGEPGIGKSRLADEVVAQARARGAQVLIGRCWEAGGAPAFLPWIQVLRAYLADADPISVRELVGLGGADLAQLLPELRDLLPKETEAPALEPDAARFRLFETITSLLASAARVRPAVLVLDDMHAADEPSLLLLQFLARRLDATRLLVVAACRDVDPTPTEPLKAALTEIGREPVATTLTLTGLTSDEIVRLVELVSGEVPPDGLAKALRDETEGNPLFVGEFVRLLAAEGRLEQFRDEMPTIPQTIRDVITRRLGRLPDECGRVLVLASVLGREFSLGALARLAGNSEDELLDGLDPAVASRVIVDAPGSPGRLRFSHVVIRDTLYEELTVTRRVRFHRLVIEALEELYGANEGQHFAELAYHSTAGGDFDRAVDYARRAGDWALNSLGYEEAARQYETALDALELSRPGNAWTRLELLLALGESEIRAGNSATARPVFLEAAEIARRLGLPREMARAAVGYGGRLIFERAAGDERLVPLFEAALAGLGAEDVDLRVRLLARLAGALRDEHSRVRRDALSAEAVDLARQSGDSAALAFALDGRASAIQAPDTVDECLGLGTELLELSLQLGDTERVVHAHNHRFIAQLCYGDIRAAEAELDASSQVADDLGQPAQLWLIYAARALLALAAGRFSEAADLIPTAYDFGKRAQGMAESVYLLQRYALCDFGGDLDEIARELEASAARHPARPVLRCALAHVHMNLGLTVEAESELEALAADDYAVLPFDLEWLHATSMLAEVCARVGAGNPAAVLYSQLAPWAHLNVVNVFEASRGSVHRYLALLAATAGRWDDARCHFGRALEINERMGALPWLAHTQEDYGLMLLTSNNASDRQRGSALLTQSAAIYHDLGMDSLVAR